jgi:hypothetical protein
LDRRRLTRTPLFFFCGICAEAIWIENAERRGSQSSRVFLILTILGPTDVLGGAEFNLKTEAAAPDQT